MPPRLTLFATLLLFGLASPFLAFAERINAYSAHIEVRENGSVFVQEEIVYDFGAQEGHGIIRHLPLIYRLSGDTKDTRIELSSIMITDGKGNLIPTQVSGGGNFSEFKIGDPDALVSGVQFYVIRYTVWGAIRPLPFSDELVWNVTGTNWSVPIERLRAEVVVPGALSSDALSGACQIAIPGSPGRACASATTTVDTETGAFEKIVFEDSALLAHGSMTVSVHFPKNIVTLIDAKGANKPTTLKGGWDALSSSGKISLLFAALLLVAGMFFLLRDLVTERVRRFRSWNLRK